MIYAIREVGTDFIKIGYTKHDPISRLTQLQTANPRELRLAWAIEGSLRDEFVLHHNWRHLHVRGEWFEDDASFVDSTEVEKFLESQQYRTSEALASDQIWGKAVLRAGSIENPFGTKHGVTNP